MSIDTTTEWFAKGMRECTKSGYENASKHFKAGDLDVNCAGKSFMITGANSGIGKVTAREVAKRGGTVHMICRNKELGEAAVEEIKKMTGNEDIHLHLLDMSEPRKVLQFAKDFEESGKALNVLVNNAGCLVHNRTVSDDGLEKNFATNTLGVHILTTSLIPVLSKTEKSRVVIVSSSGMLGQKLDVKDLQLENLNPFDGIIAYSQNKRQQVVMTQQYAKMYPSIHFSVMHPGWADTKVVRMSLPDLYKKIKNHLRTAEEGADTVVSLAISDIALKETSGQFFQDRKPEAVHLPQALTRSSAEEEQLLMTKLDDLTKQFQSSSKVGNKLMLKDSGSQSFNPVTFFLTCLFLNVCFVEYTAFELLH